MSLLSSIRMLKNGLAFTSAENGCTLHYPVHCIIRTSGYLTGGIS